jgi:hypothetical protein
MTGDRPDDSATSEADQPDIGGNGSGQDDTAQDASQVPSDKKRRDLTWLLTTLGKVLGVVVTLVTLLGASAALLFRLDPSAEPCVGGAGATFSSIQVAPNYSLRQYISDLTRGRVPNSIPHGVIGAELRYNYSTSNLSGNGIRLYSTLQEILPNGDVMAPPGPAPSPETPSPYNLQGQYGVPGEPPPVVTPNACSQDSSGLDWILVPPSRRGHPQRYRVVLEFYRGKADVFTDRVGMGQSAIFDS